MNSTERSDQEIRFTPTAPSRRQQIHLDKTSNDTTTINFLQSNRLCPLTLTLGMQPSASEPGYLPDYQGDRYTNEQRIAETQALNRPFFDTIGGAPLAPPLTPAQSTQQQNYPNQHPTSYSVNGNTNSNSNQNRYYKLLNG